MSKGKLCFIFFTALISCHQTSSHHQKMTNSQKRKQLHEQFNQKIKIELASKKNTWKNYKVKKRDIVKRLQEQKNKHRKKVTLKDIQNKLKSMEKKGAFKQSKREISRRQHDKKLKQKGQKLNKTLTLKSTKKTENRKLHRNFDDCFELKNFDFENPSIDYDFLNGNKNALDYTQIKDEEYSLEKSIDYLQILQLKLDNCYSISKNNQDNNQFQTNPKLKFCQVDFVFEIHVLRNVFIKVQQRIFELIPEVVIVEERTYTRYEFFQYIMQLEVLNYQNVILPILKTQIQLEKFVQWDIKYYQLVQNIFRIRKIVKDFQQVEYFAKRFQKKGLVVFLEGFEKEMIFLTEVQTLVNVYSKTQQGQSYLEDQKHQYEQKFKQTRKKDRKLVMQQQSQIEKLLDNKNKSVDEMIIEEQEFLNQVDNFNNDANLKFKTIGQIKYDTILKELLKQFPIFVNKKQSKNPFVEMKRKMLNNPIKEKALIKIIVNKEDVEKYKNLIRKILKIQPERKAYTIEQEIEQSKNLHKKIKQLKEQKIERQLKQQNKYVKELKRLKNLSII